MISRKNWPASLEIKPGSPRGAPAQPATQGADRHLQACSSQALTKAAARRHNKTKALPKAAPAISKARLAPGPQHRDGDNMETQPEAAPGQAPSLAAPAASRGLRRGADGHPAGGGAGAGPPGWLRPGSQEPPLPAPVHAGSRQTDARTAARPYGPTAAGRGHCWLTVALPSLRPRGDGLASPSETFLI